MALAAVLTIMVAILLAVTYYSAAIDTTPDGAGATKEPGTGHDEAEPATLEGVLVRQLIGGEISGRHYRRVMRRLAERDADRHPMTVPPH